MAVLNSFITHNTHSLAVATEQQQEKNHSLNGSAKR
jgi:hypothetical protein